jgi:hypothetical protein
VGYWNYYDDPKNFSKNYNPPHEPYEQAFMNALGQNFPEQANGIKELIAAEKEKIANKKKKAP